MKTASFYDVDGTLVASTIVHPCLWYAAHQAIPSKSIAKTASLLLRIPFYWAVDQVSRTAFNHLFYKEYTGQTRNRLLALAEEMFDSMIRPKLFPGARELVARSREAGHAQVIVTGALDFTVEPLADYLGIEHLIANRLEFKEGVATGKLLQPVIAEGDKVTAIRRFARSHKIDLNESFAYADSASDLPMLSAVGRPSAVRPDRRLKLVAAKKCWPVIEWH